MGLYCGFKHFPNLYYDTFLSVAMYTTPLFIISWYRDGKFLLCKGKVAVYMKIAQTFTSVGYRRQISKLIPQKLES